MFKVLYDFDFEAFRSTKKKELHFTEPVRLKIMSACRELSRYSRLVISPSKLRSRIIDEYFGVAYEMQLHSQLILLDNVINNTSKTITFVDGSPRQVRVKVDPNNIDAPQKIMDTSYSKEIMAQAGAWVHTLPGTGAARKPGGYQAGSGYRIILGKAFNPHDRVFLTMGVIYHELTHKILGTNDHCYDKQSCKALKGTVRAIKNADNFNCFLQHFAEDNLRGLRV